MSETVRIAMLGSGFVAEFYMQGLANVNGQQVSLNYSRTPKRAKAFAKRWGIAESATDLDAVIARDDIDLFIIALPNQEHLPEPAAILLGTSGVETLGLGFGAGGGGFGHYGVHSWTGTPP